MAKSAKSGGLSPFPALYRLVLLYAKMLLLVPEIWLGQPPISEGERGKRAFAEMSESVDFPPKMGPARGACGH
uniref:Putative secreted protein n=1 Tax=Anopheles marajoara TaxID=58244 RepID=A0A2M4CET2_9DIPT